MADPVPAPKAWAAILPDPTPRERATEAVDGRLEDLDTDLIARVRRPEDAPAAYLPYLAWERSVDVYDPAWPEAVRRAAIAAAPVVHRYKGTRYAVQAALAALRVDAEIVEWWQASPKAAPYTFKITAYARARLYDGPRLDARLVRAVYNAVLAAKPESRAFELAVGLAFTSGARLVPIAIAKVRAERAAAAIPATGLRAGLQLAAVAAAQVRVGRAMVTRLPPEDP